MLDVSASHWSSSGLEREQRTTPIGRSSKVEFTQTNVRENQMVFISVAASPLRGTRRFGAIGNTSFHVPAAAHTSSYCSKSGSTNTRK